jgi:hypothetical protein
MPDPIPLPPRQDDAAADMGSLVRLGEAEPQPIPAPATDPFQEPVYEEPAAPAPDEPA